jgi:hypothetical protein
MPIVQAAIVCAVSLLGDSPGIFTLVAVVQRSAQLAYTRSRCSSNQGPYETQGEPAGELAALRSIQVNRVSRFATTLRVAKVAERS